MALLLVSRYLDDHPEILDLFSSEILTLLKTHNDTGNNLVMGNILTGKVRDFLEKAGYDIDVVRLPRGGKGLFNKNIEMIDNAATLLAIQFENSANIQKFIDYANNVNKHVEVLKIGHADISKKLAGMP